MATPRSSSATDTSSGCVWGRKLGNWAYAMNEAAEVIDRTLRGIWAGINIGQNVAVLQGSAASSSIKLANQHLEITRTVVSVIRVIPASIKILTGRLFWEPADKRHPGGPVQKRAWVSIAMDSMITVARFLIPFNWFHRIGAMDLGKHASGIGTAICSLFAAVTVISLANTIKNWVEATAGDLESIIANFFSDLLDLFALPWDLGYCFHTPALSIAGSVLMGVQSMVWLIKEAF